MGQSYSEERDAQGRATLELHDDLPVILLVCCALSVVPLFFFGWEAVLFVAANVLVFGSLSTWFLFARRRMRVTVDAAARTLAVESGPHPRVLAFDEILGARLGAAARSRTPLHRVEIALRSGGVLPLYAGLGGFRAEGCERLADRINAALK
jgi:hypothetical protein